MEMLDGRIGWHSGPRETAGLVPQAGLNGNRGSRRDLRGGFG